MAQAARGGGHRGTAGGLAALAVRIVSAGLALALPFAVLGGVVFVRSGGLEAVAATVRGPSVVGAGELDPATRLDTAADQFERATAEDGAGFSFSVESRSTLYARPDGPKIEVPDPVDPFKTLELADEYDLGGSLATGFVEGDGDFFLQMRRGPATAAEAPDFERAEPTLAALVRDGKGYRNDGAGWYEAEQLPGIGLDPATIASLPTLLRDASEPVDAERALVDDQLLPTVKASGTIADAPGLMAVDAAPFTELAEPIAFAFDEQGRLAQLVATMRNTNSDTFELIVVTAISFDYDGPPGELPDPAADPAPPPATPEPDPAAEQQD
jgi:hypothetical protein